MPVRPTRRLSASRIAAERLTIKATASVARFSGCVEKRDAKCPNNMPYTFKTGVRLGRRTTPHFRSTAGAI